VKPWLLFGAALLAAVLGLGWLSRELLRLDERALASESSRLALWRMDLALARLVAEEATRPAADYRRPLPAAQHVRLHFDVAPDGTLSTPEAGAQSQLALLGPELARQAMPRFRANASDRSRNAVEFNRRAVLAMNNFAANEEDTSESPMAPAWSGDRLVLARRVRLEDGIHVQGVWLEWASLRASLLREIVDLFPQAQLEPVLDGAPGDALMLASLPVRLVPGPPAPVAERTTVGWSLGAAWLAFALMSAALGALLFGALALDARRAAFVSAVTHELRTPITTFKLYAEMLEDGMVPAEKQKEYLSTLRLEANRLGELVENVLAYAQIEKGRVKPLVRLSASALLERIVPRLQSRAGASLKVERVPEVHVTADPVSVEQILFNLVDNACKYAGSDVTLSCSATVTTLHLCVADEGPGVSAEVEERLFEPLRKSAQESAQTAPGIGLGLALSRRLARAMGGDLRYRKDRGASFELTLRVTNE
jgi:signal transduction histidine kinase